MTCSQRRYAEHMHVVFDRLTRSLGRRLEERTHVHVETAVGVTRSYHLGAAVVSVLAHLGDHDTRLTALLLGELLGQFAGTLEVAVVLCL